LQTHLCNGCITSQRHSPTTSLRVIRTYLGGDMCSPNVRQRESHRNLLQITPCALPILRIWSQWFHSDWRYVIWWWINDVSQRFILNMMAIKAIGKLTFTKQGKPSHNKCICEVYIVLFGSRDDYKTILSIHIKNLYSKLLNKTYVG